jgi:hypothetical protein
MRRATGGEGLGLALLLALGAWGCGDDQPPASATVRPIGPKAQAETPPADAAEDWATEAAEPEDSESAPEAGNQPPRIAGLQILPGLELRGQDVRARAQAEDPDGDEIEIHYTWRVNGDEVEADGPTFSTLSLQRGDTVQVQVVASDGRADSEPVDGPLLTVENGAPRILSRPAPPGPDGAFRYQVAAEDPEDEGALRYRLTEAPAGMTITPLGGLVEWQPRPDQTGVHPVQIVVEDAGGAASHQSFELTTTPPASSAP